MQFLDTSNGFALIGNTFIATMDGGADWVQRPMAQGMSDLSFSVARPRWLAGRSGPTPSGTPPTGG